jgi:hypothetical protein
MKRARLSTATTGQGLLFSPLLGFRRRLPQPRAPGLDHWEDAELVVLLAALAAEAELRPPADPNQWVRRTPAAARRWEFTFPQVVAAARSAGAFPWLLGVTGELTHHAKSTLGRRLAILDTGKFFELPDGRRVQLSHRGRNRHRRYRLEFLQPVPV